MLCGSNVSSFIPKRLFIAGFAFAGLFPLTGCGKKTAEGELPPEAPETAVDVLPQKNNMKGLPGMVYATAESSPIHWQPWVKESQEMARKSHRLMLVVIAIPQQPSYSRILSEFASDPSTVAEINQSYVPVLVDGDAVRELGILTAELCSEIRSGLHLPIMVWMTPNCDPLAWIPLVPNESGSVLELFRQSHGMVGNMWIEDPKYVSANSRMDQENRSARIRAKAADRALSDEPAADSLRAVRQLTTLYDPVTGGVDEAGGLFPCGMIEVLSMAARMEEIPGDLREKSSTTLGGLLDILLVSPMFDPLDGGVYSSRRGNTWRLPGFQRDCSTQARVAASLFDAYDIVRDDRVLKRALGILEFVEKTYRTQNGLFSLMSGMEGDTEDWLWRYEDIKDWLDDEEFSAWVEVSGMKPSGNLPSETDPLRNFFRANSISYAKTTDQVAELLGIDPESAGDHISRAREKLLKVRNSRLKSAAESREGNAAATFRMVSAYASAYRITGNDVFRERAVSTLTKAREIFSDGPRLRSYDRDLAPSLVAGRAFIYGLAIQAALDVSAVTLDETWILWAGDVLSTASEIFIQDKSLRECPSDANMTGLPIADIIMLLDESSMGLFSMAVSRLEAIGASLPPAFSKYVDGLPLNALDHPVVYTDVIQAALMREYGATYLIGGKASDKIRDRIVRSPLKGVNRRLSSSGTHGGLEPDAKGALLITPGNKVRSIESVDAIAVPPLP
jgi:uncharacterized protein